MAAILAGVAAVVLVLAAVLAPWFHGTAYEWERRLFETILIAGCLGPALVAGFLRPPRAPALFSVGIWMTLVCGGAFLAWNARAMYDPGLAIFGTLRQPLPGWPGAVDPEAAVQGVRSLLALASVWFAVMAAVQFPGFRKTLWTALIISGAAIALYGIVQRVAGVPLLVWEGKSIFRESFGPFYYHGNAASYLNMILPLAVLRTVLEVKRGRRGLTAAFFTTCAILCSAAALMNVSKIGQIVAVSILAWIAADQAWRYRAEFRRLPALYKILLPIFATGLAALLLAIAFSKLGVKRWEDFGNRANPMAKRLDAWQLAMELLPAAGATGLGPGTFAVAFESRRVERTIRVPERWLYLHNDYLQTAIELGWAGAALSAVLAFGSLVRGVRQWLVCGGRKSRCGGEDFHLLRAAAMGAAGVLIHAAFDFPFQMPALGLHAVILLALLWTAPDWICAHQERATVSASTLPRADASAGLSP